MEKSNITQNYIDEYVSSLSTMNVTEVIYHLVEKRIIDRIRVRNAMIIKDFDILNKLNSQPIMNIYDDLAYKYDLSVDSIRLIIQNRKINEF